MENRGLDISVNARPMLQKSASRLSWARVPLLLRIAPLSIPSCIYF